MAKFSWMNEASTGIREKTEELCALRPNDSIEYIYSDKFQIYTMLNDFKRQFMLNGYWPVLCDWSNIKKSCCQVWSVSAQNRLLTGVLIDWKQ